MTDPGQRKIKQEKKELTPKRIGAIVGAYTGMLCGDFGDMHEYIEEIMGGSVFTHEMGNEVRAEQIKAKAKPDFLRLAAWCAGKEEGT